MNLLTSVPNSFSFASLSAFSLSVASASRPRRILSSKFFLKSPREPRYSGLAKLRRAKYSDRSFWIGVPVRMTRRWTLSAVRAWKVRVSAPSASGCPPFLEGEYANQFGEAYLHSSGGDLRPPATTLSARPPALPAMFVMSRKKQSSLLVSLRLSMTGEGQLTGQRDSPSLRLHPSPHRRDQRLLAPFPVYDQRIDRSFP